MRTSEKKVNKLLKNQIELLLIKAIADLRNLDEAKEFLEHFLTESERETLAKRLAIAYWLKKGRSYANIKENLKVSSATISSVQDISSKKGLENILKKIVADEWATQWADKISKAWPSGLKKFVGK
jgi:TrpR-related protein YerC/YecD